MSALGRFWLSLPAGRGPKRPPWPALGALWREIGPLGLIRLGRLDRDRGAVRFERRKPRPAARSDVNDRHYRSIRHRRGQRRIDQPIMESFGRLALARLERHAAHKPFAF